MCVCVCVCACVCGHPSTGNCCAVLDCGHLHRPGQSGCVFCMSVLCTSYQRKTWCCVESLSRHRAGPQGVCACGLQSLETTQEPISAGLLFGGRPRNLQLGFLLWGQPRNNSAGVPSLGMTWEPCSWGSFFGDDPGTLQWGSFFWGQTRNN